MAQSTTNLGKIHVFPSESLYNQFKDIIADNDLALLKDDGAYIVAALLEQNGYVKFSNGLILQWGLASTATGRAPALFPIAFPNAIFSVVAVSHYTGFAISQLTLTGFSTTINSDTGDGLLWWIAIGR